jgi:metal-responsive CopG/Arc/MetJ family transcriptional regulator
MKTAVSIPDPVFEEAERLAKRLKTSRSEIYARALEQFIGEHAPDRITDALNSVVEAVDGGSDEFVQEASRQALARTEW